MIFSFAFLFLAISVTLQCKMTQISMRFIPYRVVICVKLRAEVTQVTVVKSVKLSHNLIEIVK